VVLLLFAWEGYGTISISSIVVQLVQPDQTFRPAHPCQALVDLHVFQFANI